MVVAPFPFCPPLAIMPADRVQQNAATQQDGEGMKEAKGESQQLLRARETDGQEKTHQDRQAVVATGQQDDCGRQRQKEREQQKQRWYDEECEVQEYDGQRGSQ